MPLVYNGLKLNTYIGNYKIVEINNEKLIVSDEFYPAEKNEPQIKRKTFIISDFDQLGEMITDTVKIDVHDDQSILNYCNKYGLTRSLLKINEFVTKGIIKKAEPNQFDRRDTIRACSH